MNAPEPTTQTPPAHARKTYVQGTTARVIKKLNGAVKNLDLLVKKDVVRISAQLGKQLYDLNAHVPLITTDINTTIERIQQNLNFLSSLKSKIAPILTDQANQLFNENAELQKTANELESEANQLVAKINKLCENPTAGSQQKLLLELKEIERQTPLIRDKIKQLESNQNATRIVLNKFLDSTTAQSGELKTAQQLTTTHGSEHKQ